MEIASFPKIAVRIDTFEGKIDHVELSLADSFACIFLEALPKGLLEWLENYAAGRTISLPDVFSFEGLTPFQSNALRQMESISFGKTKSYRELASMCGNPKGARAIGGVCSRNPFPLFFPCHRVIASGGKIGGFSLDPEIKRRLLLFEGKKTPALATHD
jgi:methylated-DNA-[protein]-cysteine S-methyltransferase